MAVFKLKPRLAPTDDSPIRWTFDRTEVIADGVVHAFGVSFGLVGAIALFLIRPASTSIDVAVYAASLITMLGLSATYNLWPSIPP